MANNYTSGKENKDSNKKDSEETISDTIKAAFITGKYQIKANWLNLAGLLVVGLILAHYQNYLVIRNYTPMSPQPAQSVLEKAETQKPDSSSAPVVKPTVNPTLVPEKTEEDTIKESKPPNASFFVPVLTPTLPSKRRLGIEDSYPKEWSNSAKIVKEKPKTLIEEIGEITTPVWNKAGSIIIKLPESVRLFLFVIVVVGGIFRIFTGES